jgi:hypothetical protein
MWQLLVGTSCQLIYCTNTDDTANCRHAWHNTNKNLSCLIKQRPSINVTSSWSNWGKVKTREAMYVYCSIQACWWNHCCRGWEVLHISVCVWMRVSTHTCMGAQARACACMHIALLIQHTMDHHIVTYSISGSTTPWHYLKNSIIFGKKLLNIKCVFWFSLQLLFKTFIILRRI